MKYCNFEEYSICISLWSLMVPPGEPLVLLCSPMLLVGRTNKSHEAIPSNCKGGSLAPQCGYSSLHDRRVNLSEQMNINRGVALLIWSTHSHLSSTLVEERSSWRRRRIRFLISLLVLPFYLFGASILRKILLGFPFRVFPG